MYNSDAAKVQEMTSAALAARFCCCASSSTIHSAVISLFLALFLLLCSYCLTQLKLYLERFALIIFRLRRRPVSCILYLNYIIGAWQEIQYTKISRGSPMPCPQKMSIIVMHLLLSICMKDPLKFSRQFTNY